MRELALNDSILRPQGFFEVQLISPEGEVVQTEYAKNIITYSATNVFARSLGGDATYNPTHILVGGDTVAPGVFPAVDRADTDLSGSSVFRSELPITAKGFAGFATSGAPAGQQNSNVVTFTAIMPGFPDDIALQGKEFFEAGIITKIGGTNILVTHQFHNPIMKLEGFQLVYTWSIRFL